MARAYSYGPGVPQPSDEPPANPEPTDPREPEPMHDAPTSPERDIGVNEILRALGYGRVGRRRQAQQDRFDITAGEH
jgi:hypothetical protein